MVWETGDSSVMRVRYLEDTVLAKPGLWVELTANVVFAVRIDLRWSAAISDSRPRDARKARCANTIAVTVLGGKLNLNLLNSRTADGLWTDLSDGCTAKYQDGKANIFAAAD